MSWLTVDAPNIMTGWGGPPQLHAPEISGMVRAILQNRQFQQEQTQKSIADTIKQLQQQRESSAYTDALQKAGLLPEGDYGGLGIKGGESLADMIQRQKAEQALEAHRAGLLGIAQQRVGRGRGGGSSDGGDVEVPEDYYGLSVAPGKPSLQTRRINPTTGLVEIQKARGRWEVGPKWMQEQQSGTAQPGAAPSTKPLSPSQINSMLKGYGIDRADIVGGQHAGFKGGEPLPKDRPWTEAEEIEITPRAGGAPVKIPRSVFEEMKNQVYGTQGTTPAQPEAGGGADKNVAHGYGYTPKPGDVEQGYRFKGGDPKDRNNWELVQ